ncbi:MAG: serine-type D-Ala-D-Ala carboxypeptidase D-alanyl-D-alanine carboxypeptidase [Parcubacteria group bacterium]|nr:serine-type D-Ala-D-Ala carboxypeptidase D-alanyl-D-alanine carboxypeptidase [Parcubacteria group bacterium]
MKASDNPELKNLIARVEHGRLMKETATATMAALGLIGFGIMMVPVLGSHAAPQQVAVVAPVTTPIEHKSAYAGISLQGHAAIVYDLTTGKVIFEKNSQSQLPLASLTKLLTMYAAVNTLDANSPVVISDAALAEEGDSGFTAGETFAFKDLARLALVASSNDAAEAIAEAAATKNATSGKQLLAGAAAAAGLTQTYALNGTGLDETTQVSGGYGSAQDVAVLAGALLKKAPSIARSTIEQEITIRDTNGFSHTLPNTNQDIVHVPNPLLSKTGFTDLAGGNLVVVFDAGIGHPIAVVVLGSTRDGRFSDIETLVGRTLDHFADTSAP